MKTPKAIILRTAGTNCDEETAYALRLAGALPERVHINRLTNGEKHLMDYQILVIPGGFSYGDDVSAGKLLANELRYNIGAELDEFVKKGFLVIGICNGFQVLAKARLLPGWDDDEQSVTLTNNDSGRFMCRWVQIKKLDSCCKWLGNMPDIFELPIAHGEGKFLPLNKSILDKIIARKQVVFAYNGDNPNGSVNAIAGICNPGGNIIGLMPHPERYITRYQHPMGTSSGNGTDDGVGIHFFRAAVIYAGKRV